DRVEHRHGVRVLQAAGDPGLAHRSVLGDRGLSLRDTRRRAQLLDGHGALETLVPALPDHAHAAGGDHRVEAVAPGEHGSRHAHEHSLPRDDLTDRAYGRTPESSLWTVRPRRRPAAG